MELLISQYRWIKRIAMQFIEFEVLLWIIALCPCAMADSNDLADRFLREAPPKWKEYEEFVNRFQGVISYKCTENGKVVDLWNYDIKQNHSCMLVITRYIEAGPGSPRRKAAEAVHAYNPEYTFSLDRMTERRPWLISDCEKRTVAKRANTEQRTRDEGISIYALVSVQPAVRLSDLVQRPSFHVLYAKRVQRAGRELIQVAFDNNHTLADKTKPYCAVVSGNLFLDPARSWYLVSADLQELWADAKGRGTIENTISKMDGDWPIPEQSVNSEFMTLTDGRPQELVITYKFDLTAPAMLPEDKEFTLSAFGLPEPFGTAKRTISWYRWVALAGFICLSFALLFRWLARRAKTKVAP